VICPHLKPLPYNYFPKKGVVLYTWLLSCSTIANYQKEGLAALYSGPSVTRAQAMRPR
jgi:hypothetical protein